MSRETFSVAGLLAALVVLAAGSARAGSDSGAYSTVIQPNGKIVAAGWGERGTQRVFGLARYEKNGALDTGFGLRGKVTTPIGVKARAGGLALQADGKIVAAGYAGSGFALARYTSKGTLDAGFGKGGAVRTAFGSSPSEAEAVAIQANGRIVAAGAILKKSTRTGAGFALVRYRANGSLDTSFGADGKVTTTIDSGGAASALVIQPDGKIVVAGSSSGKFALARYNPEGSLETSFGTGGTVLTSIGTGSAAANALALQPDGKIVAVGSARSSVGVPPTSEDSFALARYKPDGSLDMVSSTIFIPFECDLCSAGANAVALQPDGKLVLAGQVYDGSSSRGEFALARYEPDGSADTSFSSGGVVRTSFGFPEPANGTSGDVAAALGLQSDGKILAAGYSQFGPHTEQYLFALARYRANGSLDTSFGKGGKVNTSVAFCVVPNVKGQKLVHATGNIRRAHCGLGKVKTAFSSKVKRKHVISQKPSPKKLLAEGAKVSLVVSRGRR